MARTTIDFGIDLGTTNSAVAVLKGVVPEIIKNNFDNDITPSAVYIDKRGQVRVGLQAKNQMEKEELADDVYIEFKRRMGSDWQYKFKTAGKVMRPEEVSAEVLKALHADAQQRIVGDEVNAAVITVPAAFQQRQCDATRKAAELAGFSQCALLQEPVAAALAYGFQATLAKGYWLVYDFGGGTFDAALMQAEEGSVTVVNHGGDNFLGGSDIDWAVMEQLVLPHISKNYNFPGFARGAAKWRTALAVLKRAVESAKIQCNRSETVFLEECRIADADGKVVEIEYTFKRSDLVRVAEPIIMSSIDICKRVLKEKSLSPSAIEKVILVGGPTLAPYFREILQKNLGVALDYTVDPLTVVAKGAAVFAGTQRIEVKPIVNVGQYGVDLNYKPVDSVDNPAVRGKVAAQSNTSVDGFTIEFSNQRTKWSSGRVPLRNGSFKVDLLAEKGVQNVFSILLFDVQGSKQQVVPDSLVYTMGLAISEQPLCNSIGLALANNKADFFFKKGDSLPTKANKVYRSAHSLKKGESGEVLNIPVIEGEMAAADRNLLVGTLKINGANIRRDLPAGSELEVALNLDANRKIRVKAYVPILDEEFDVIIEYDLRVPDSKKLGSDLEHEIKWAEVVQSKIASVDSSEQVEELEKESIAKKEQEIRQLVSAAKTDPDAAKKAEKELLALQIQLDHAEEMIQWPALVAEANKDLYGVEESIEQVKDQEKAAEFQKRAKDLRIEVEEIVSQKRVAALHKKIEDIADLNRDVLAEVPAFWVAFFKHLVDQKASMPDQVLADKLIAQGLQHIEKGNLEGLRAIALQLLQLFPREVAAGMQRGFESGLLSQ